MRKLISIALFYLPALFCQAQITEVSVPLNLEKKVTISKNEPVLQLPFIDLPRLQKEDELNDKFKDKPWRFGENITVSASPNTHGIWFKLGDKLVWQLEIVATGAVSLNYFFDEFFLPESAKLFILNTQTGANFGAITAVNNSAANNLSTWPFEGSKHLLQLEVANQEAPLVKLHLQQITHGYRGLKGTDGQGDSDPCNINAICPDAAPWALQRKSTVMIVSNGNGACSGTLINNTLNNRRPFILTAEHCGSNVSNWAFRFNFQSSDCATNVYSAPHKSVSGAKQLAHNGESDFSLLEMNNIPPESYDVYYAGWDRSDDIPTSQFVFHHPSGDLKKFSQNDNAGIAGFYMDQGFGTKTWKVDAWEKGTTEGGSSGSGLYDQYGRIIGQLLGGEASCNTPEKPDYFGRLAISFKDNTCDSTKTLAYWLDPSSSGIATLNGILPNAPVSNVDIAINGVTGFCNRICGTSINPVVKLVNLGAQTINSFTLNLAIDGGSPTTIPWNGNLVTGGSTEIVLNSITLTAGGHTVEIGVTGIDKGTDEVEYNNTFNRTLQVEPAGLAHQMTVVLDNFGSENSWEIVDENNNVVLTDGPFAEGESGSQISSTLCLKPGCYKLKFTDGYGDGMCCNFGSGSYTLVESRGDTLASGWRTEPGPPNEPIVEETPFCIAPVGISEHTIELAHMHPNPTAGDLFIQSQTNLTTLKLINLTGQVVHTQKLTFGINHVNLKLLPNGLYLAIFSNEHGQQIERVELMK